MITNYYSTNFSQIQPAKSFEKMNSVSFKQNIPHALTHTNIGSCLEGYIGKVAVRKGNAEAVLNVFKSFKENAIENYTIKNDAGDIIGTIDVSIRKYRQEPWDRTDPSHVFVDELRNFSNPNTPYYKQGLDYYKDIGTRLLQIAQRRSDEAQCQGNIKLISKGESLNWYKNVIGMRQEFPPIPGMKFNIHNPNQLYLPPENKEPLSKLQGGL